MVLHENCIFNNFRDIWRNMFHASNSEGSFHPFNIDDFQKKKKKRKHGSNIFLKTTLTLNFIKIND